MLHLNIQEQTLKPLKVTEIDHAYCDLDNVSMQTRCF